MAFAPLSADNDNLARVWHFDPEVQNIAPEFGWFVFNPRAVFGPANNIISVEAGVSAFTNKQILGDICVGKV